MISATTATFGAMIRGASQDSGDPEKLALGVSLADQTAWNTLLSLVTTKYAVHVPLDPATDPVVDVVRGAGEGTLTISGLGTVTAVLTALNRSTYARGDRTVGTAQFLITGAWS